MKLVPLFAVGLLSCLQAHEDVPPGPTGRDLPALVAGPLTEVNHWSDVPARVREVLEGRWRAAPAAPPTSREEAIADPGEDFQEGDAVMDLGLPIRRLVLAAKAPGAWLVCYEQGGEGLSFHLVSVPFETGNVRGKPHWFWFKPPYPKDLRSLQAAVREHRYSRAD
ncbi:MAG TPA: hypothetical protein VOA80_14470 [Thermoanaerobaculia bacterium]|nr:hypothetical protein [Thermoanaerobaculia bacterium]